MTEQKNANGLYAIPTPDEEIITEKQAQNGEVAVFTALGSKLATNAFGNYPKREKDEDGRDIEPKKEALPLDIGKRGKPLIIEYSIFASVKDEVENERIIIPSLGEFERTVYDTIVTVWQNFGTNYVFSARQLLQIMTGRDYIPKGNNDDLVAKIEAIIKSFDQTTIKVNITPQKNAWHGDTNLFGELCTTNKGESEKDNTYIITDRFLHISTAVRQNKNYKTEETVFILRAEPILLTYCKFSGNELISYSRASLDITKQDGKQLQVRENNILLTQHLRKRIAIMDNQADRALKAELRAATKRGQNAETDINKLLKKQERRITYASLYDLIENKAEDSKKLQDKKEKQRLRETVKEILNSFKCDNTIADFKEYTEDELHPSKRSKTARGIEIILHQETTP